MIDIELRLFGAFRKYESKGNSLRLQAPEAISVKELKALLADRLKESFSDFQDTQLIEDSAVADETRVLALDHVLTKPCSLLILPPVCGG